MWPKMYLTADTREFVVQLDDGKPDADSEGWEDKVLAKLLGEDNGDIHDESR